MEKLTPKQKLRDGETGWMNKMSKSTVTTMPQKGGLLIEDKTFCF